MSKQKIFKNNFFYKLLFFYARIFHRIYYKKITVAGLENIPKNVPLLFAPNHQNALMDALAILFAANRPVGFLARADIFKKAFVANLLNTLKIMPVYRMRDGFETLSNNKEIFQKTIDVLKSEIPICILPEGNHLGEKRLRPLKKGIGRIAFQAETEESFQLGLHIIPVGIDYSNYFNAGTDLLVHFGKPISIADYKQLLSENPVKALNSFTSDLSAQMKNLMIHIPETHYETILQSTKMYEPNVWNTLNLKRHPYNKLVIKQYIAQKASEVLNENLELFNQLSNQMQEYNQKLKEFKIRDWLLQEKQIKALPLFLEIVLTMLVLPLHIIGMLFFYIPYKIPVYAAKSIKDPIFKGSIRFGAALLLFPIYYLILLLALHFFSPFERINVVLALTLPVIGYFTFYNYIHLLKLQGKIRLFLLKTFKKPEYNNIQEKRKEIIQIIQTITKH